MKLTKVGALVAGAVLVFSACAGGGAATPGPSGASKGTIKIGIELPLSGGEVANGEPTRNGVLLAIEEANKAGGVGGYQVTDNTQDDAVNGVHDPQQGARNAQTLVADTAVIGVVGPFNSNVARAIIPVTNEAGLALCSPANTGVDLTKAGSEQYRPKNPNQRNYFRVATPDDVQGPAGAQFAFQDLGKRAAYVIDDTEAFGKGVADSFQAEFEKLTGKVVKRDGNNYKTNTDFTALLTAAKQLNPDVLFFGGTQTNGGGQLKKQMAAVGLNVPLVGPDGITDLIVGGGEGGFITLAGVENAGDTYGTIAGIHDIPDPKSFADKFQAKFGKQPGAYSALAYACTQIILQAVGKVAGTSADMAALRNATRASIFSGAKFTTVLGELSIDTNGDSSQKYISFYKVDKAAEGGKGGWVYVKQQDFGTR